VLLLNVQQWKKFLNFLKNTLTSINQLQILVASSYEDFFFYFLENSFCKIYQKYDKIDKGKNKEATMQNRPIIIGVTGGSGGGKTSVSKAILSHFPNEKISMIEHDSYYKDQSHLTFEERIKTNYDHPFAFDTDLMIEQIKELLAGRPVDIPTYDYAAHTRSSKTYRQEPQDVFIVEGILVLEDKRLRDLMDIKIFVDTDDDVRIIRRIKRDMEERGRSLDSVIDQYLGVVKPMYHQFIEPTKRYADIVIPEGVTNTVAIDLLTTKIEKILEEARLAQ